MPPFIADPTTYDKTTAYTAAVTLCREFLDLNSLAHPEYVPTPGPVRGVWKDRGLYVPTHGTVPARVYVDLKKSRPPTRTPGFSWTFPGSKADLTAVGVTAHETGHHVHALLGLADVSKIAKALFRHEAAVSGYEPHVGESIAEAFRLFILNPQLLREGRPFRWNFMVDVLGLEPLHDMPWRQVLVHAHPRLVKALEGWMTRKKP